MTDNLFAYIDETGDRGVSPGSSPWFALVAALVASENDRVQRALIAGIRDQIVGTDRALHWSEHFRARHGGRRRDAAALIARAPADLLVVAVHKQCLRKGAGMADDSAVFYNYAYRLLLERIAYSARDWPGGRRMVTVRADSVKGMNHRGTLAYLDWARRTPSRFPVPWQLLRWPPTWHASGNFDGLQLADLYASTLGHSLRGNGSQYVEPWAPLIRYSNTSAIWSRGFKVITECGPRCLPPDLATALTQKIQGGPGSHH